MHPCPAAGGSTRETRNSTLTHRSAIETYFFESEERPHVREVNAGLWGQRGRFRTPGGGGRRVNLIHDVKYRAGGLVHRQLEHSKNISIKSQAGVADTRSVRSLNCSKRRGGGPGAVLHFVGRMADCGVGVYVDSPPIPASPRRLQCCVLAARVDADLG